MAVDKALTGLEMSDMQQRMKDNEETVEISIENPDSVAIETEDGGLLIDFDPDSMNQEEEFGSNLAEFVDEDVLSALGTELVSAYESDKSSRKDWEKSYMKGLEQLGLKAEDRTTPWPGACGVHHPLLSEAVVRFQSQAITEIFPASGPAKTKIVGKINQEKEKQASRIQDYMNYLLTERMTEYGSEMERLLFSLPLAGSAFKKIYYDDTMKRAVSKFVAAEDLVVPYYVTNLYECERITHLVKMSENDVLKKQKSGFYRDVDLLDTDEESDVQDKYNEIEGVSKTSLGDDYQYSILEMHVDLDLDEYTEQEEEKKIKPKLSIEQMANEWIEVLKKTATHSVSVGKFEQNLNPLRKEFLSELQTIYTDLIQQQRIETAYISLQKQITNRKQ